jgi:hypothetical protein
MITMSPPGGNGGERRHAPLRSPDPSGKVELAGQHPVSERGPLLISEQQSGAVTDLGIPHRDSVRANIHLDTSPLVLAEAALPEVVHGCPPIQLSDLFRLDSSELGTRDWVVTSLVAG